MTTIIEKFITALRSASVFYPDVQAGPACILWPDKEYQWKAIIPRLQIDMPELMVLGDYDPEKRTGPAIWLRCVIAGKIERVPMTDKTPIFYLPGVSRQDLRAVETCPDMLKPLAELQYRGVIWSQTNARDWTILAFLKSEQGGLGLDTAQDHKTRNAMKLALCRLMDEDLDLLKGRHLGKDYFNTLLTGGDPVKDFLNWIDQGDAFKAGRGENEWRAFVEVCESQLAFNPEDQGDLSGAEKLAKGEGPWRSVWERFREAPQRYPNIPDRIRKCVMPLDLFANADSHGGWPQWNEDQENELRSALNALNNLPPHEAAKRIVQLAHHHKERRDLVWSELGQAPLAQALSHLHVLAETTANPLSAGTADDLATGYATLGWQADDAVARALSCLEHPGDVDAVTTAIRSVYLPWIEASARHLQNIVEQFGYPGKSLPAPDPQPVTNACVLFVDGLRFDVARRLEKMLVQKGREVVEKTSWTALPSVTATCKPAVSPVCHLIRGEETSVDFEPVVATSGQSLRGGHYFKKLLAENGWDVLEKSDSGKGQGKAWCEFGYIDHDGHGRGWKLTKYLDGTLAEICGRVDQLLAAGWASVRIVTDHGWLLMPGGLPKIALPGALTEIKWGRCAAVKHGVVSDERLYPWFWNPVRQFALADGVGCFRGEKEYTHGGLSLQECLVLELTVRDAKDRVCGVEITDIVWRGLRCKVAVEGNYAGLRIDIRTHAGNPETSLVMNVNPVKENGTGSVVIEDEEREGNEAVVVLMDAAGVLMAQSTTVVGETAKASFCTPAPK